MAPRPLLLAILAQLLLASPSLAAPALPPIEPTKVYTLSGDIYAPTGTNLRGFDSAFPFPTGDVKVTNVELAEGQALDDPSGNSFDFEDIDQPQPIRGSRGGTFASPRNQVLEKQHPDTLAPPTSDHGAVPQLEWPMALSHAKLGLNRAGWSRQQNADVLPAATQMSGVNMRLEAGAYRELHCRHPSTTRRGWALMLNGSARIQAVDTEGRTFIDDVSKGDVWFFPSGIPHSIQGLENGTEFMLVFDDGDFSEDGTFLVSETFAFTPKEVLAKNFDVDISAFDNIPKGELFIFNGTEPPKDIHAQNVTGPAGSIPNVDSYSFHWSQQQPIVTPGGTVKVIDTKTFPIAAQISAALVTIKPGAMRELHWHPSSDEWNFFLSGNARISVYAAKGNARTFDYQEGDVGYIPKSMSHYIENIGDTDVVVLEVLKSARFTDVSVGQWLALTPSQVVQETLHLSDDTIRHLSKEKPLIVKGTSN
ncbi:RmlC-like cupin domain-containing protein [Peziza echinospora]|nr:RmlC-like cupin domain-containing protein [Peziza echinospora]